MTPPARYAMAAVLVVVWAALGGCSTPAPQSPTAAAERRAQNSAVPAALPAAVPEAGAEDWQVAGSSVEGRLIRYRTFGHGPRKVLFVGGIHGDETEGAYTTAQLPAAFAGEGLADAVTLTVLEDANPDGRAAKTRGNANGVDINRNFPAANFDTTNPSFGGSPLSQPESRTVYELIQRVQPNLVLVAHSWVGKKFVNFDGPARDIAQRFSQASGLPVEASSAFAPTPGSLGSFVGRDRGIPILTIELLHGSDAEADWNSLRGAVLEAIRG